MRGGSGCSLARAGARGSPYTLADRRAIGPTRPLSRPFFRFYPVFDTGNSPAPQAISVTSKPNVATGGRAGPAAGSSGGRARPRSAWRSGTPGPGETAQGRAARARTNIAYFDTCRQSLADSTFVSHSVRGIRSRERGPDHASSAAANTASSITCGKSMCARRHTDYGNSTSSHHYTTLIAACAASCAPVQRDPLKLRPQRAQYDAGEEPNTTLGPTEPASVVT